LVKRLVVKTSNARTLLENMHELGASFYCKGEGDTYQVLYFAVNREIRFEGKLSSEQLEKIACESVLVNSIRIDEFNDEIIIEEG